MSIDSPPTQPTAPQLPLQSAPVQSAPAKHRRFSARALIPFLLLVGFVAYWFHTRSGPALNVIEVSGRIEGDDSAVATKPGGRVLEITVREGDTVQTGQVIARIDAAQVKAREEQARFTQAQAEAQFRSRQEQIAVLEAQLEQSHLVVDQARQDAEGKIIQAQQQVLGADANILQAQAKVRSARQQIAVLEAQLEQSHLVVDQARQDAEGRVTQAEQQLSAAEATLAQAQAQQRQAEAQHRQAETDTRRYVSLAQEGAVSPQTAEQAQTSEA